MSQKSNRILITGPIFDTPYGPSGQGGKLYVKLKEEGYVVYKKSRIKNRFLRFLDILSFLIFCSHRYDTIFVQMFSLRAFILEQFTSLIAVVLKKRFLPIIRGGAFAEFYNQDPKKVDRVLKRASVILTPSKFIQEFLVSKGYIVKYIPNFINTDLFPYKYEIRQNSYKLLWVRAFNDIYNPELAIKAIEGIKQVFPNVKLTMIGPDQGTLERYRLMISSLGLEENIDIIGVVSNLELNTYYSNHDVYLNTTNYESFGVALIEAACSGIPIVSTDVGEIPYLWSHNHNILLSEKGNQEDFKNNILKLLNDEVLRLQLSKNAREFASSFDFNNMKNELFKYL